MQSLFTFTSEPDTCGYLHDRDWRMRYDVVISADAEEYGERLKSGWRRFGHAMFRPECRGCSQCISLRVIADRFKPDRSQRRCAKLNETGIELEIGTPLVDRERLDLYDKYHAFQTDAKAWPHHDPKEPRSYAESFVLNPFPTEEWRYRIDGELVGVGYVDHLPGVGLSAIYFFYDPDIRDRSPGTWNVLQVIDRCRELGLPHAYLGYFVEGCGSLAYKARFRPFETLGPDGEWKLGGE